MTEDHEEHDLVSVRICADDGEGFLDLFGVAD